MIEKIECVVLRIQDYKDNDLLLHVISKDRGFLSIVARSAKKMTSKQKFFESCLYEFIIDYKDMKTIYTNMGSKLLKSYYDLSDTNLMSYKNIFFDLLLKSKELYEPEMFNNLLIFLNNIDNSNKYMIGSLFVSYLSLTHGIIPNVDECVVCKNKKVVSISNQFGGFLCLEHSSGTLPQDINTLKKFRLITKARFKDLDIIRDNEYVFNDFKLVIDFFLHNTGLLSKPYDFYRSLN